MKNKVLDTKTLQEPTLKEKFQNTCHPSESKNIEERTKMIYSVMDKAVSEKVSTLRKPNNIWISQETMQLSDSKRAAKQN